MRLALGGLIWASLLAVGCQLDGAPNLVRLDRIYPARASAGDQVGLTGDGFPAGRGATVDFRGDLFRPGMEPRRDVRIRLPASPDGRNALTVRFDPAAEQRFTGAGPAALHTTFSGEVRVVFQPGVSGVTEVAGAATNVRFDVLPSVERSPEATAGTAEGSHTLAFLGVTASADPSGGVRIAAMSPGGRAALAGIREGDLMVDLDGVTVLSTEDLRVRGGERVARLTVERGAERRTFELDVHGLAPLGASAWMPPSTVLLSLSALVALFMTPLAAALRWAARLVREPGGGSDKGGGLWSRAPAVKGAGTGERALVAGKVAVLVLLVAAFARLALGRRVVSPDLDLVIGPLGATLALVAARGAHGALGSGRVSFVSGASAVLRTACFTLPVLLGLLGSVIAGSRFVIADIVAAQGGLPWRWAAMQNPGLLALAVVFVASTAPEATAPGTGELERGNASLTSASFGGALVRLAEWAYLWIVLGVTVLVFFGGYRVPGVTASVQDGSRALLWVGAALFFAKTAGLAAAVLSVRWRARGVLLSDVTGLWLRSAVPGSVAGCVVAAVWATLLDSTSSGALADWTGHATLATLVLAILLGVVLHRMPRPAANLAVNPWL